MTKLYSINGSSKGDIALPPVFSTDYRPDVIHRAVVALQSASRQPYGPTPISGLQTSAEYFGNRRHTYRITINRSISRLPRVKPGGGGLGDVRRVPQAKGGRKAHPPKMQDYSKKINNKEYLLALQSAIGASAVRELVEGRGHMPGKEVPLVVEDTIQSVKKTSELVEALTKLGLEKEIDRARNGSKTRAGKGKMRGKRRRQCKSLLIVVAEDKGIKSAAKNLPGFDAVTLDELDVELLAPGSMPGRLALWSKSALDRLEGVVGK